MSGVASAALAALFVAGAFVWLLRQERAGKSFLSVYFVFALVVVEAALYPSPDTIPVWSRQTTSIEYGSMSVRAARGSVLFR